MIYKIDKTLHGKFRVFEKNKLPPRAYTIPYSDACKLENTSLIDERYNSDIATVLSGDWDFRLYKSVRDLPDVLNTSRVKFGSIPVPGDWQRNGIMPPVYLNCPYEFKGDFPGVPEDMPVGVYRKIITLENPQENSIISFLGVANNIALYVNSQYAGYSEGTHNTAEFLVGGMLKKGKNEIVAVSFKWCNGSYLESQDMFRENGIFRDVLLYQYGKSYIYDFEFSYSKNEENYSADILIDVCGELKDKNLSVTLKTFDGSIIAEKSAGAESRTKISLNELKVTEWNAEEPTVYYLYITLSDGNNSQTVRQTVGFKRIEIDGPVFRFNDAPIKCKGVNHHDSTLNGYVMTLEEMETDIRLMKELNVNTVRTSHYPPDPFFLTLADIYGLYIVDEADIEVHGCDVLLGDTSYISCNRKWIPYFVDRVKRMYYRDRNHPSLLMWSLGNESGGYTCQDKCYEFLKSTGTKIPVHFESVRWKKRFHYDVISEMYTSTESMEEMIAGKHRRDWDKGVTKRPCHEYEKYPYFLCEFCHAMGMGPGNLEEYTDIFYRWDSSMGGCIWEWCDHTVYHPKTDRKYKYSYTYGGDHSEVEDVDWACCDGLVYADRRLHTGAKEMKVVFRPIRAFCETNGIFRFENTNRFRDSSYIDFGWEYLENGILKAEGKFNLNVQPMQSLCFKIDLPEICKTSDCHINFTYTDKKTGTEIATEQLTLNKAPYQYPVECKNNIRLSSDNGLETVSFDNGECVFDRKSGEMVSLRIDGKEILSGKAFIPVTFRGMTDNDKPNAGRWKNAGLNRLRKKLTHFSIRTEPERADIGTEFALYSKRKKYFVCKINYSVYSSGAIKITAKLECTADTPRDVLDIPCFGMTAELDRELEYIEYYGRGPAENMPDFKCHAPVGIYSTTVSQETEPYVFPQESGMHCDTKRIALANKKGQSITVYAPDGVAFTAHPYSTEDIEKARHIEDLHDMGKTYLSLYGAIRGFGSGSCGPDTRKEYRLDATNGYAFSIFIVPGKEQ